MPNTENQINHLVPFKREFKDSDRLFFMTNDGLHEIYDGVVNKLYEKATVSFDPASFSGDYGCAVVHRLDDNGDLEIVHIEYLEPKK